MCALKKNDKILYEAITEKDLVPKKTLERIVKEAETSGQGLMQLLVSSNLLMEKDALSLLADKLKFAYIDLKEVKIDKSVIDKVPIKIASYYKFLPIEIKDRALTIAVSYPLDIKTQDEIMMQLGYDIEIALAPSDNILDGLKRYYGLAADTLHQITYGKVQAQTERQTSYEKIEDIEKLADDASVIKLVNQIISEGWKKRATDIHIEPYRGGVELRYRIDGVLYDAKVPPEINNFLDAIISRIKIMANLNIVERRLPQDGRIVVRVQDQVLDLRISTMPTPFGESVVIRILPTEMLFSLEKLGLSKIDLQSFEGIIQRPHGIIFVTGPTGSGKTTTLYASLARINTKDRKIITLEDPIEYEMHGIIQIQVMPEIDFDFARGLRSILRHDPDVIMVGEVRDLETAEIAVRVALTGHLVFSTLHTNDAASGVTRLVDIGVEPYLVASSVEAFIAQRLIRLICPNCKYEDKNAPQELRNSIAKDLHLKTADEVKIFRGKGCPNCNNTGFFGRTAIYEILLIDDAMKELILRKLPSVQLKKVAISKGMRTLRQDGWFKVINGLTTPEEVMKVTSAESQEEAGEGVSISSPSKEEKRVYSRLDSQVNIRYKIFGSEKELIKQGFAREQLSVSKNISAGGLLFVSEEPLTVGSILEVKMELPDGGKTVECLARIARVEDGGKDTYNVAACFLDIASAERARLSKYVDSEMRM